MTHTGEEWFHFSRWDYAIVIGFVVVYLILVFSDKLPKMDSLKELVSVMNSRGGNILILAIFALYFFRAAMTLIYHLLGLPPEVTKESAIAMTAIGFVTGTAFGGAWGALLKTMTGSDSTVRTADRNNGAPPAPTPAPGAPKATEAT